MNKNIAIEDLVNLSYATSSRRYRITINNPIIIKVLDKLKPRVRSYFIQIAIDNWLSSQQKNKVASKKIDLEGVEDEDIGMMLKDSIGDLT